LENVLRAWALVKVKTLIGMDQMLKLIFKPNLNKYSIRMNNSGIQYFDTAGFYLQLERIKQSVTKDVKLLNEDRDTYIQTIVNGHIKNLNFKFWLSLIVITFIYLAYLVINY
jgi:hypothetical protein